MLPPMVSQPSPVTFLKDLVCPFHVSCSLENACRMKFPQADLQFSYVATPSVTGKLTEVVNGCAFL